MLTAVTGDIYNNIHEPEALKSLYRSPGNKKNQLVLCVDTLGGICIS
jgi:hypothetical protein